MAGVHGGETTSRGVSSEIRWRRKEC
ncbi:hypothetical protein MJ579_27270 [Klebsiella pneumoniae]|nr:hypothetical protein MJ579_27270 [Klebsiella pneumoniae]